MHEDKSHFAGLYEHYGYLGAYVAKLEPTVITQMYKDFKSEKTFYPNVGIFFNEFALIYSANAHAGRPVANQSKALR